MLLFLLPPYDMIPRTARPVCFCEISLGLIVKVEELSVHEDALKRGALLSGFKA